MFSCLYCRVAVLSARSGFIFFIHPQPEQGEVALQRVVGEYLEHGVAKPAGGGHSCRAALQQIHALCLLHYVGVERHDKSAAVYDVCPQTEVYG